MLLICLSSLETFETSKYCLLQRLRLTTRPYLHNFLSTAAMYFWRFRWHLTVVMAKKSGGEQGCWRALRSGGSILVCFLEAARGRNLKPAIENEMGIRVLNRCQFFLLIFTWGLNAHLTLFIWGHSAHRTKCAWFFFICRSPFNGAVKVSVNCTFFCHQ